MGTEHSTSPRNVHYHVTQREEQTWRQGFYKQIREVFRAAHGGQRKLKELHFLAYEEVATVDVRGPQMVLRVISKVDRRFVVEVHSGSAAGPSPSSCRRAGK
eukprot:407479-Pleurochrysis_carterae.AAC.1